MSNLNFFRDELSYVIGEGYTSFEDPNEFGLDKFDFDVIYQTLFSHYAEDKVTSIGQESKPESRLISYEDYFTEFYKVWKSSKVDVSFNRKLTTRLTMNGVQQLKQLQFRHLPLTMTFKIFGNLVKLQRAIVLYGEIPDIYREVLMNCYDTTFHFPNIKG